MTNEVRIVTLESENAELRRQLAGVLAQVLNERVAAMQERIRFYESVMQHQAPHGDKCKIAKAAGLACCNPQCRGDWGTGCWCCHALSFAYNANHALMESHLALKIK